MNATIEVIPGDPFGLVPALLHKAGARAAQTDPTVGGAVISSATDELTSACVTADAGGNDFFGACSLGPSGARGHGVIAKRDPSGHIVGTWTVNPPANWYGAGFALAVTGTGVQIGLGAHQAQSPPRISDVFPAYLPDVATPFGGGGGGGVTMDQVNAAIAAALANFQGGGGMTIAELISGLQTNHDLRQALGSLMQSATVAGMEQAVTTDHIYRTGEGGLITSATQAADSAEGVLTKGNFGQEFHDDPAVYARIRDTTWEQDNKVEQGEKP